MSSGIALNFNTEEGDVETYLESNTPECLAGKCNYVKLVWIQLDEETGFNQLYCEKSDKPVFDIYKEKEVCPDNRWSKI